MSSWPLLIAAVNWCSNLFNVSNLFINIALCQGSFNRKSNKNDRHCHAPDQLGKLETDSKLIMTTPNSININEAQHLYGFVYILEIQCQGTSSTSLSPSVNFSFIFFEFQFPSYFDYFCSTGLEFVYFLAAPSSEIQLRILLSNQLVPATKIFVCKYLGGNYHIV